MRNRLLVVLAIVSSLYAGSMFYVNRISAESIECSDVLFLYLRGSGNRPPGDTDKDGSLLEFNGQPEGVAYSQALKDVLPSEIKLRAESLNYPAWRADPEILWADFDIGFLNARQLS